MDMVFIITTEPFCCLIIWGSAALVTCMAAVQLNSTDSSQVSSGKSVIFSKGGCLKALFTNASMLPNSATAASARAWHWAGSVTSVGTQRAWRPRDRISSATSSSFEAVREASTTFAPCSAHRREMSRPMPGPIPETMTVRSSSSIASSEGARKVPREGGG